MNRTLSPEHEQRENLRIDDTYETFTAKVAEGRKRPVEEVHKVARGRVWTGADAAEIGLVDELGGLDRALAVAVELTGAAAETRADARPFPKKESAMSRLRKKKPQSSDDIAAAARALLTPTGIVAHLGTDPRRHWVR